MAVYSDLLTTENGRYPSIYNYAMQGCVLYQRGSMLPRARKGLAMAIKHYRTISKAHGLAMAADASFLGWPVRKRPNGRHR